MSVSPRSMFARLGLVSVSFWLSFSALADGTTPVVPAGTDPAAAAAGAPQPPGTLGMLMPFLLMFAVVYFLMIRPQQRKMKEHQNLLSGLKPGDEIITASGILGTVSALSDKVVTIEVDQNVRVKMLKTQIAQIVKGPIQDLKTV